MYPKISEQYAKALQGLNPKVNIWETGPKGDSQLDIASVVLNAVKVFAPIMDAVQTQTDFRVPDWLLKKQNTGKTSKKSDNKKKVNVSVEADVGEH